MRCWLEKTTSTADGFSTLALLIVISVCCAAHTEAGVLNRPPSTHRDSITLLTVRLLYFLSLHILQKPHECITIY